MRTGPVLAPLLRQFYNQFYNRFAFTYDVVSYVVSRGEWRTWTRSAIPFLHGHYVLEIAFGTGNLQLDLAGAGYPAVGVDLSPHMIEITRSKFKKRGISPQILRASVRALPFPSGHFDSIVMTFPPGFSSDQPAMEEIRRALSDEGRLIWVDAPYLYPRDAWSRLLNWAYGVTGNAGAPGGIQELRSPRRENANDPGSAELFDLMPRDGWSWEIHRVEGERGYVHVMVGKKSDNPVGAQHVAHP